MESQKSNPRCVRCGSSLHGPYCSHCGERVLTAKDSSLKHLVADFLGSLFNFDNKLFHTLRLLLTKPGELTRLYKIGVRRKYLKPIQVYLIANLIYFLFPIVDSLNTTLFTQMNGLPYSRMVKPAIEQKISKSGLELDAFQAVYNKQSKEVGKLIVIIIVPLLGILFQLLYWRQAQMTFVDHMILSFNFVSLLIFGAFLVFPWILFQVVRWAGLAFGNVIYEGVISIYLLIFILVFLGEAFRRLVGGKRWAHYLKALIVVFFIIPILMIYRFVLLWVTLALI